MHAHIHRRSHKHFCSLLRVYLVRLVHLCSPATVATGKRNTGRVIEGMERDKKRRKTSISLFLSPSLYLRGLDRLPASRQPRRAPTRERGRHDLCTPCGGECHGLLDALVLTWPLTPSFLSCHPPLHAILPPVVPRLLSLSPSLSTHYPTLSSSSTAVKPARSRGNPPYTHVHISRTRDERPVEGWRKKENDCVRMRQRRDSRKGQNQFSDLEKRRIHNQIIQLNKIDHLIIDKTHRILNENSR